MSSTVWMDVEWEAMTTPVSAKFLAPMGQEGQRLVTRLKAEFERIEALMSSYRNSSEVSILNQTAAQTPVAVSRELIQLLLTANEISRISAGAFDITYASVGRFYDYRKKQAPSEAQIDGALPAIDYRHIRVDPQSRQISYAHEGVYVDLGGIAKGYAVDRAVELLKNAAVQQGIISAGGDTRLLGDKSGSPWMVAIKNPRSVSGNAEDSNVALLPLVDTAISTSGDYERYFVRGDERIHHIIAPETGKPVKGVQSVSVIGPEATMTDGLSTAVFVMGRKKGLAMIEELAGYEAVIIDDQRRMHFSSGLMNPEQ